MAYRINQDCIACGDCAVVCPRDAIEDGYTYNAEGDVNSTTDVVMDGAMAHAEELGFYNITSNCDDCGSCVGVCPAEAIERVD